MSDAQDHGPSRRATAETLAHRRGSFAGNTFWTFVAHGVSKAASFAFVVIVARALPVADYGYFNFAVSFVPLFLMFGTWGLDVVLIRDLAKDPSRLSPVFASGVFLRVGLGFTALGIAIASGPLLLGPTRAWLAVVIVGGALLIDELGSFVGAVFRGVERMAIHAGVVTANRIVTTLATLVAYLMGTGLVGISITYLIGSLLALMFGVGILLLRFPPISLSDASRAEMARMLREGFPLGVADFLNMIVFRLDAVMLQWIRGPVAVAMYGIAYRFFESFLFVVWSLASAALPRITRFQNPEEAARTLNVALTAVLSVYVPIAVGAPFGATWVVEVVFSQRYAAAAAAVSWLTTALVLYGIAHLARVASIAAGKRSEIAKIAAGAVAVNIAANAVLIPRYGFVGAAVATVITELVESVILVRLYRRVNPWTARDRFLLVPLVAGAAMASVLLLTGVHNAAAVLVGAVAYCLAFATAGMLIVPRQTMGAIRRVRARVPSSRPAR